MYVLDNKDVMYVLNCNAYIVKGHNDMKYGFTLHPDICSVRHRQDATTFLQYVPLKKSTITQAEVDEAYE